MIRAGIFNASLYFFELAYQEKRYTYNPSLLCNKINFAISITVG